MRISFCLLYLALFSTLCFNLHSHTNNNVITISRIDSRKERAGYSRSSCSFVPAYAPPIPAPIRPFSDYLQACPDRDFALQPSESPFPFYISNTATTDPITSSPPPPLSQRALEKRPVRDQDTDPVAIEDSQLQNLAPALQADDPPTDRGQSPPSITQIENQSSKRRSFLEALLDRQQRRGQRRENQAARTRVLNPINYVPRPTRVQIDRQTHLPPGAEPGTGEVHTLLTLPEQRRSRQFTQEGEVVEHSPQLSSAGGSRTSVGLPPNRSRTSVLGSNQPSPAMVADEKVPPPEKAHTGASKHDDLEGQRTQQAAPSRLASQYGMSPLDQPSQPPRRVSSHRSLRHFRSQTSLRSTAPSRTATGNGDAPPMPPPPRATGYPNNEEADVAEELAWGPSHPCFPHPNAHVPLASPEHSNTRIIRIKRDWMVVGDLAPTFSNIYPEILDPAMGEQEFRYIIRHINSTLIRAFDPYSTPNFLDGLLGFVTGWLWEDFRPGGVKGQMRRLEAWMENWNRDHGSREGIKLIPLRRTGCMNFDIQIPDPQVRVVTDDEGGERGAAS